LRFSGGLKLDQVELYAALNCSETPTLVYDADKGVTSKNFGELVVHGIADFGTEFFDGHEAADDGLAIRMFVFNIV